MWPSVRVVLHQSFPPPTDQAVAEKLLRPSSCSSTILFQPSLQLSTSVSSCFYRAVLPFLLDFSFSATPDRSLFGTLLSTSLCFLNSAPFFGSKHKNISTVLFGKKYCSFFIFWEIKKDWMLPRFVRATNIMSDSVTLSNVHYYDISWWCHGILFMSAEQPWWAA